MTRIRTALSILITIVLLSACSIQKRIYMDGYHTEWKGRSQAAKALPPLKGNGEAVHQAPVVEVEQNNTPLTASVTDAPLAEVSAGARLLKKEASKTSSRVKAAGLTLECDILTLKNGDEIMVKVLEITEREIKYKRCDNPDGPTITIFKSKVFSVKYPNGTKDVFNTSSSAVETISGVSGKSQIIALALCIFLGGLGIHRFYLGHIGMGVLYLFTAGLCGIGWIIDIILIATGQLKPKDEEYTETL